RAIHQNGSASARMASAQGCSNVMFMSPPAPRFPWAVGVRDGRAFILDSGHSRILRVPLEGLGTTPPAAPPVG
ncbi:MAG: hypothetical protein ACKPBA_01100, partial [Planctomycetota bacterium]